MGIGRRGTCGKKAEVFLHQETREGICDEEAFEQKPGRDERSPKLIR